MRLKAPVPRHGRFARPMSERDDAAPDIERAAAHLDAAVGRHPTADGWAGRSARPGAPRDWPARRGPAPAASPQVGAGRAGPRLVHAAAGLGEEIARLDRRPASTAPSSKANRYVVLRPRLLSCQRSSCELSGSARAPRPRCAAAPAAGPRRIDPDGIAQQVILVQADQAGDLGAAQRRRGGADAVRQGAVKVQASPCAVTGTTPAELQGQRIPGLQQVAHHLRGAQRGVANFIS